MAVGTGVISNQVEVASEEAEDLAVLAVAALEVAEPEEAGNQFYIPALR